MTGAMLNGITAVLEIILNMIQLLVLASVVISWVGADPSNQIVQMIRAITEPLYRPVRRFTSKIPGPIDWAPMIVILIVVFFHRGILPYLRILAIQSMGGFN